MKITDNVLNIAYSKLFDLNIPWNSAEVFEEACKLGFDGVKGDVCPSADGKLIMCHDSEFQLDEKGRVYEPGNTGVSVKEIGEMTCEECIKLEYGSEPCKEYLGYYAKVAQLEDLVRICHKYSKFPYITVRDTQIQKCVDEVYRLLVKYDMVDNCMINSFTTETLRKVREKGENIALSYVQEINTPLTFEAVDTAAELGNCVVCVFWSVKDEALFDDMYQKSLEAIKYAKEKGVVLYIAHGADKKSYKTGLERGFKGFQCLTSDCFK